MTQDTPGAGADAGAIFDAHVRAEFVERDLDGTMATMTEAPYVTHVPVLTGGHGRAEVRSFCGRYFIGRWPADTRIHSLSRTVGQGRVIDELVMSFSTTSRCLPCSLASRPPVVRSSCRSWWSWASRTAGSPTSTSIGTRPRCWCRSGLIDPLTLPVSGAEQARKLLDPTLPSNELIERAEQRLAG